MNVNIAGKTAFVLATELGSFITGEIIEINGRLDFA